MRNRGARKLVAALFIGLTIGASAPAADPKEPAKNDSKSTSSWLPSWLGGKKEDEKKPAERSDKSSKKTAATEKETAAEDAAAKARAKELANYLRRVAVCDQLEQVALDSRDDELQRQVEQLKDRVWTNCSQRMASIPAAGPTSDSDDAIPKNKKAVTSLSAKDRTDDSLETSARVRRPDRRAAAQ